MRSLELFLKRLLFRLISSIRQKKQFNPSELPLQSFKRILILRQHDQLGDLLLATPAIRAVRKKYPDAFIALVVREYTAPLVEHNPNIDEVIVFYEKLWRWNISRLIGFWRSLRGGFDCAIVLNTISRSLSTDCIALASGAKYIVGPDHLSHEPSMPERIYNVLVHRDPNEKHEIERNLDIVRALGADENDLEYDLVLSDEEVGKAEEVYQSLRIDPRKRIVGVHFGALNPSKCFPLEKLATIIDWMIDEYSVEAILFAGPNEMERRRDILSRLHHGVSSVPVIPLRIMAAMMRHCDLFICNDTGTLHVAASQRRPTISFHSLSDPAIWKPPHPRHVAVRASDFLITSITVGQVQSAIRTSMNTYVNK